MLRFLPAMLWAGLIFALSHRQKLPDVPVSFPGLDKFLHAGVYGVLGVLLMFAMRWPTGRRRLLVIALCTLYGITDELHQVFVPGRSADPLDLLADAVGAALAVATVSFWHERKRRDRIARGASCNNQVSTDSKATRRR